MSKGETYTRAEFVDKYGSFIHKAVRGTGIFAGTLIAQAVLESSGKDQYGNWKVGGSKLSRESNNFFGIKDSAGWKGKTYNIDTGEVIGGNKVTVNADFRAYNSVKDSIKDYVDFLKSNPRYSNAGVFTATDVKEQAKRLKQAGYATAPTYADTVNQIYNSIKPNVDKSYIKYKRERTTKIIVYSSIYIGLLIVGFLAIRKQNK
jgi:flagellar protein FlgJ